MKEEINLIEYRGFKDIFVGLYKGKNYYYIMYGKTGNININCDYNYYYDTLNKNAFVEIPFIASNNNSLYTCVPLNNKEEYDKIISILEAIL